MNAQREGSGDTVFRLKFFLAFAILTIVGLLLLIVGITIESKNSFWSLALNQVSTALIVSGLFSGIYEFLLRLDFLSTNRKNTQRLLREVDQTKLCLIEVQNRIIKEIVLSRDSSLLGLCEVHVNSNQYDYSNLIESAQTLSIVLNDGKGWVSRHSLALKTRFRDPGKKTTFFFLHPESEMLRVLARKVGVREKTLDENHKALKDKIGDTISELRQIKNSNTQLEIFGHHLYNPYSLYLTEKQAIITPYFFSRERRPIPMLLFDARTDGGECYYNELKGDVEDLKQDSEDISKFRA
ncbi:hypothetical protein ACN4EK_13350 [Pantanalinema rosaneae CENA516]|uniref:hypothetical protein n=1 Tax=Pantanalinema rosaneae TaxID=1620701 RepID=UPI003D6E87FD